MDVTPGGASITKRDGYGVYKALGTGKALHGGFHGFDSSGNDVQIWGSSTSLYGIVADATPTQLVSSATLNSTWDCADTQSNFYCVNSNRDFLIRTDGATTTFVSSASAKGTMVEATPDRLVVAGVSGSPSTLFVSQANVFTNFAIGINADSAFQEVLGAPGSKITHIRWGCGKLLWWKDASFGYMDFDNQFNLQIKTVSDTIGTFDNTSAIDPGGSVWFRGQDGHTWKYDCSFLTKESIDITPNIQASGKRTANLWTQTTQSDWSAGTFFPSSNFSTTISNGDITQSSFTAIDTSSSDFVLGTLTDVDTTTVSGALSLKRYINEPFTSGLGGYSDAGCSVTMASDGSGHIHPNTTAGGACASKSSTFNSAIFVQADVHKASSGGSLNGVGFCNGNTGAGYLFYENRTAPGVESLQFIRATQCNSFFSTLTLISSMTYTLGTTDTLIVKKDASNNFSLLVNGSVVMSPSDATYTTFTVSFLISSPGSSNDNWIDNSYNIAMSGSFASRTFDTSISSNIATLQANWTVNTSTPYVELQTSSDAATWRKLTSSTGTNNTTDRYVRYLSSFTTSLTQSPSTTFDDATIVAKSTGGVFYSQLKNAPNANAWSTFSANTQATGGTHTFYFRSSTASFTATSTTPTWTAQNNGGLVAVATGTWFQVRDDFTTASATGTLSLNDFTVNWFEGSATDQAYMIYFDNAIWETVAFGSGQSTNNYIFKRDLINDAWTLYNFGAGGMCVQANTLYFGDTSSTGGNIFNFGTVTSDNGTAINAFWKSKEFTGGDPFMQNQLQQIDLFAKKDQGTTLTATYTTDTSSSTAYSVSLSTSNAITQSRKQLPSGKLGYTFNYKIGDTSTSSAWEVLGYRITFTPQPYRPAN